MTAATTVWLVHVVLAVSKSASPSAQLHRSCRTRGKVRAAAFQYMTLESGRLLSLVSTILPCTALNRTAACPILTFVLWPSPELVSGILSCRSSGGSEGVNSDERSEATSAKLAALSVTVFTRLTTHSRFAPLLLTPDAVRTPLPPSAERLPLPLTSLLPLVEADAAPEQVCRSTRQPGTV